MWSLNNSVGLWLRNDYNTIFKRILTKNCLLHTLDIRRGITSSRLPFGQTYRQLQENYQPILGRKFFRLQPFYLVRILSLFRTVGLCTHDIYYVCRTNWTAICNISSPQGFKNSLYIIKQLSVVGTNLSKINLHDILIYNPDILSWTPKDLKYCLIETEKAGVPWSDLLSVLSELKKFGKKSLDSACLINQDKTDLDHILQDTAHRFQHIEKNTLRHYFCNYSMVPLCYNDILTILNQLQHDDLLDTTIEKKEFHSLCYIFFCLRLCDTESSADIIYNICKDIHQKFDFFNVLYPRFEFLRQHHYLINGFELKEIIEFSSFYFSQWLRQNHISATIYDIFSHHMLPLSLTFHSFNIHIENEPDLSFENNSIKQLSGYPSVSLNASLQILSHILTGYQLHQLLNTLPKRIPLTTKSAHFYRWHLVGRMGFSIPDILQSLPKLLTISDAHLRQMIDKTLLFTAEFKNSTSKSYQHTFKTIQIWLKHFNSISMSPTGPITHSNTPLLLPIDNQDLQDLSKTSPDSETKETQRNYSEIQTTTQIVSKCDTVIFNHSSIDNSLAVIPEISKELDCQHSMEPQRNIYLSYTSPLSSPPVPQRNLSLPTTPNQSSYVIHNNTMLLSQTTVTDIFSFLNLSKNEKQWIIHHLDIQQLLSLNRLKTLIMTYFLPYLPPSLPVHLLFIHIFSHIPTALTIEEQSLSMIRRIETLLSKKIFTFILTPAPNLKSSLSQYSTIETNSCQQCPYTITLESALLFSDKLDLNIHHYSREDNNDKCVCTSDDPIWCSKIYYPYDKETELEENYTSIHTSSPFLCRWLRLSDAKFDIACRQIVEKYNIV